MERFKKDLEEQLQIIIDRNMEIKFEKYYHILIEENEKYNLTAITDKLEVYYKHFYDSLTVARYYRFDNKTLLDVGSGAGFPSIPLKICYPTLKVVIVEASLKRVNFLKMLVFELDLEGVEIIHERIEKYQNRNAFYYVTARAVARLNVLAELCLPFVKLNGYFIAYKGKEFLTELVEANNAISILGGTFNITLDFTVMDRMNHIIVIHKINKTEPMYPRDYAKIKKNPLK